MIGVRHLRKRLVLASIVAVAAAGLATGGVGAATPGWAISVTPTPAAVTSGADAGYVITVTNTGKSNISQAYLTDALLAKDGTTASPGEILPTSYVDQSQGSCDAAGVRLRCSLGSIRAHRSATVVVAYSTGTADPFRRVFEVNTTGVAGDAGDSSHGDALQAAGETAIGAGANFAGRFIVDHALVVNDLTTLGGDNLQSTKVTAPQGAIGVSVKDGSLGSACPTALPCWSEASEIHVDNGATFTKGFVVEIGIYKDLSKTVHGFYHAFDSPHLDSAGNPTILGEYVPTTCPKSGTPSANQLPCLTVTKLPGGNLSIAVWLKENGTIRFN